MNDITVWRSKPQASAWPLLRLALPADEVHVWCAWVDVWDRPSLRAYYRSLLSADETARLNRLALDRPRGLTLDMSQLVFTLVECAIRANFDTRIADRVNEWQFGLHELGGTHLLALAVRHGDAAALATRICEALPPCPRRIEGQMKAPAQRGVEVAFEENSASMSTLNVCTQARLSRFGQWRYLARINDCQSIPHFGRTRRISAKPLDSVMTKTQHMPPV